MLDVKDISNLGAHYTSRKMVHYICAETLANRVSNELNMNSESILNYIRFGDSLLESILLKSLLKKLIIMYHNSLFLKLRFVI